MIRIAGRRDWQRHHPLPKRIARQIPAELLALRTRTLVADIRTRFDVSPSTAHLAVGFARKAAA